MPSVAPGEVFLGKYVIEKILGQGGMGIVVAARHKDLDELVAIKFLHPMFAAQQDQVERFLREGRAAAKIKSEHVARVRDVGKCEDGAPYMIMEHLTGNDLGQLIKAEGKVAMPDAVEYVLQACEALAEAHTSGIVHRDLKPANLFLTERADGSPCVKLLDFGISKLLDSTDAALTATNGMMGSPLYMAPEQLAAAKNVDKRADLWALGVILFELLTAERPFAAETLPQLVLRVATDPPTPLRTFLPEAPEGLEQVISRCLAKPMDERFENVGALAKALEPYAPPEALPSIERIARVLAASTTGGGRRQRTVRTSPQPPESRISPLSQVEAAETIATGPVPKAAGASKSLVSTNMGSVQTAPPPAEGQTKRTGLVIALGGVAAIAIGIGLMLGAKKEPTPAVAAPPTVTAPATPSAAATPTATVTAPPSAKTTTSATATIEPQPSATASTAPSVIGTAKPVIKGPTAPTTAKPTASAKPNCDPPYTIDAEGNKKYKMECL